MTGAQEEQRLWGEGSEGTFGHQVEREGNHGDRTVNATCPTHCPQPARHSRSA